jgi:cyclopropane fatty-acyl-phospholipid synthase-like methyltransferase
MNNMKLTPNIPQYWEMLYEQGKDDWDLGKATPALLEFFEHPSCPRSGDVLVPGAGRGWDAEAWAKRGHNVIAIDFCSSAFDILEKLSDKINNLIALNTDMFLLNPSDKKVYGKKFDIIYDYCSFNSIHPGRRDEYIEMLFRMLKDDGLMIGFFFPLNDERYNETPPYSISRSELEVRLNGMFKIENKIVPKKSVKDKTVDRTGIEEIWLLRKII